MSNDSQFNFPYFFLNNLKFIWIWTFKVLQKFIELAWEFSWTCILSYDLKYHHPHWPFSRTLHSTLLRFSQYQMFDISWSEWKASENDIFSLCVYFHNSLRKSISELNFVTRKKEEEEERRIVQRQNGEMMMMMMMMMMFETDYETQVELLCLDFPITPLHTPCHSDKWRNSFLLFF
jgi:hypothetical protein